MNIPNILITFEFMGNKHEMKFNYRTPVSKVLNEFANKICLNLFNLQFIYNNSIIMNNEAKNVEDFFKENNVYISVNYINNMMKTTSMND